MSFSNCDVVTSFVTSLFRCYPINGDVSLIPVSFLANQKSRYMFALSASLCSCCMLSRAPSSVLGMTLFGGKFCEKDDGTPCNCADLRNSSVTCYCDRKNFDTLLWSLVTVFQVM